jgi:hypothetical protein
MSSMICPGLAACRSERFFGGKSTLSDSQSA